MNRVKDKIKPEEDMEVVEKNTHIPATEKNDGWFKAAFMLFFSGLVATMWHFVKKPVLITLRWTVISGAVFLFLLFVREEPVPISAMAISIIMIVLGAVGVALIRKD